MNSSTEAVELRKQFGMDQEDAKANMDHLKSKAKDMVAVLLNVFAQLPRESRGMVGEVIGIWTGIMGDAVSLSPLSAFHFALSPFSLCSWNHGRTAKLISRISKKHTKA